VLLPSEDVFEKGHLERFQETFQVVPKSLKPVKVLDALKGFKDVYLRATTRIWP
jgi:hypothetical protein